MNIMTKEDFKNLFLEDFYGKNFVLEIFEIKALEKLVEDFYDISQEEIFHLSKRELYMLRKMYGVFDNGVCQSRSGIVEEFNLSSSRVSEIIKEAKRKLHGYYRKNEELFSKVTEFKHLKESFNKLNLNDISFEKLQIPTLVIEYLKTSNINNLHDFFNISEEDLLNILGKFDNILLPLRKCVLPIFYQSVDIPIEDLDFSTRTYNVLMRAKISNVSELLQQVKENDDFFKMRNMGQYCVKEIISKIHDLGYAFIFENSTEVNNMLREQNEKKEIVNPQVEIIKDNVETSIEKYRRLSKEKEMLQQKLLALDAELAELLNVHGSELERQEDGTTRK